MKDPHTASIHHGECLCGEVKFRIDGELGPAVYCHCGRCRKSSGAAHVATASVARQDFNILHGSHLMNVYTFEDVDRNFCSRCGSAIYSVRTSSPDILRIRLGSLCTDAEKGPERHIFVASRARWHQITDALPQHLERP